MENKYNVYFVYYIIQIKPKYKQTSKDQFESLQFPYSKNGGLMKNELFLKMNCTKYNFVQSQIMLNFISLLAK